MPIPDRFVALIHSARMKNHAPKLAAAFPTVWGTTLRSVTVDSSKPPHAKVDHELIASILAPPNGPARIGVLFVVDARRDDVAALVDQYDYAVPVVEVRSAKGSWDIATALQSHLEYFGIVPSPDPTNARKALDMFLEQHPDVRALNKATSAADDASAFREPRLLLGSLHFLYRVAVLWEDAKRRGHTRSRATPRLTQPTRSALTSLVQHNSFDVSDAADRTEKKWLWTCDDGVTRYFGWHLKWNLSGAFSPETFCRVYYHVEKSPAAEPVLWIGHCGEHL
jgi:hypothetical protein